MTWSPIARGFLTGKYKRNTNMPKDSRFNNEKEYGGFFPEWINDYLSERAFEILKVIENITRKRDCLPVHISLAWNLSRKFISSTIMGPKTIP